MKTTDSVEGSGERRIKILFNFLWSLTSVYRTIKSRRRTPSGKYKINGSIDEITGSNEIVRKKVELPTRDNTFYIIFRALNESIRDFKLETSGFIIVNVIQGV